MQFCPLNYKVKNMTNQLKLIAGILLMLVGISSCMNKNRDKARMEAQSFNTYVDSIDRADHTYTAENWQAIDREYNAREARLQEKIADLEAEDKAKTEESRQKYAALKARYEQKLSENNSTTVVVDNKQSLRDALFGMGRINADMRFDWVTPSNILSTYENFVNTVNANKDKYSREDWDEIKLMYEALDTRKNEIEKEISGSDNRKIAMQKVKFVEIKAANRPMMKEEENSKAKEMD